MSESHPTYERVLRPRRSLLSLDWRRLLQYRDLLIILVRRDFVARYQQTILGPLWFIIQPLIGMLVFTVFLGKGLGASTDGLPAHLFYLCGLVCWGYFANILGTAGNTFQGNAAVFTKVYFPRLILPLSVVIGSLATFALQLALFLVFYIPALLAEKTWHPRPELLMLLPLGLIQMGVLALGASLLTSGLSAKYRDLQHALPYLLQIGMFATPVVFPLSQLGERTRAIASLNPLTPVVELFRLGFFGVGTVDVTLWVVSVASTLFIFVLGLLVFQRAERTFADTV